MPDIPDNHIKSSNGRQEAADDNGSATFSRSMVHKLIPFMIYLAVWGVIYIGNRHYAEQLELQINDLQEDLQTYRAEYLTMKSELMFRTKQSQVAKMVDTIGLQELTTPPEKIRLEKVEPAKER